MKIETAVGELPSLADGPAGAPALVLGHGAGAGMRSDFMEFAARGLAERGMRVVRFDFPYLVAGRKTPDRQLVLEDAFRGVADHVRATERPPRLYLGGKSLGGRIASHIVASGADAQGLVFLGYPLHPPGRPDRLREAHLREIRAPMLFVEGTRDPFCPLDTLEKVRAGLEAPTRVAVIEGGDHSLKVRKSSGRSTEQAWTEALDAVVEWVQSHR